MVVDFDCCGASYSFGLVLAEDQTMLRHASLVDQMFAMTESQHAIDHPECPPG